MRRSLSSLDSWVNCPERNSSTAHCAGGRDARPEAGYDHGEESFVEARGMEIVARGVASAAAVRVHLSDELLIARAERSE